MRRLLVESWALGWPIILIMFFQFSIGIADVYVAGYLGTNILAAVGYVGQLYWTLMILANAITVGTVSMMSQAYGAKSPEGVANITANSLTAGVFVAGSLTILSRLYPENIIRLAGMPEDIRVLAVQFLAIFSLVLVPTYLMIITSGILRASGRVRGAMVNSFIAAVVNVTCDFIFTFGWGPVPALGFRGIAWATATATTLGMCLNLALIVLGPGGITLRALAAPKLRCLKNLAKLGVPSALQQTAWNAGTLVVYFLVGQLQAGQITALAAMSGGVRVEAIIFLPVFALNMASAVLTGNRIGKGDIAGARAGAKVTALMSFVIILVPTILIFTFARQIGASFTSDPAVINEITRYLRINMVGTPFLAVGITLSGALQGAGDTRGTMRIIFAGMWVFRIPLMLAMIHVFKCGPVGIWWSMTVSMALMCALLANRFRQGYWVNASVDKVSKALLWEGCLGEKPSQNQK